MDELFEIVLVSEGRLPPTASFAAGIPFFLKSQFAIIVLFWTTLWAVKFSFLLYYKKLFVGLPGHMQKCWWAVVIFSLLAYLGCWATQIAACVPISSYFTGQCNTPRDIYVGNLSLYYAMAVDIICDILIMALPLRLLWGLQINTRQKSALAGIFLLGIIIIVFAIVRVVETSATFDHVNPMWLALWSMVEASVAVVVSCLPSFRAFLSNRTSSYWKDRYTSSDSRLSRLSRTPKGTVRLDTFASPGGSPPDTSALQNPGRGLENVTGLTSSGMRTGYTAVAECMHPYETIFRDRGDSESEENILPIMPQDSVHVRNDFYMTEEIV
ncbi:hypothetical protein MMC19_007537 [Ptychographa xylographoides]|nr:hypothetical protein [Ptychographa xylographoides]